MAINVQCYLMPNKIYVMLCYVMYADTDRKHTLVQTETKAITVYCTWLKTSIEHHWRDTDKAWIKDQLKRNIIELHKCMRLHMNK